MSYVGKILGTAGAETAKGLLEGIGGLATSIRGAITGELPPEARATLEALAIEADKMALDGQVAINLVEAKHTSLFIAGWRPFIGWTCGLALSWHFLLHPVVIWYMAIKLPDLALPPPLDLSQLYPVVIGMLGLGVFRTYEKSKNAQGNH
jgi:hypothetical protein